MRYIMRYIMRYNMRYIMRYIIRVIFIILFYSWETLESSKMQCETEKEADLLQQR